ncbi:MAG TPA: hypothetical protein DD473_10665 [Planctomycetaceae bacterium]|nr:hypothetical protein [Planctomycetaceae bacterium]
MSNFLLRRIIEFYISDGIQTFLNSGDKSNLSFFHIRIGKADSRDNDLSTYVRFNDEIFSLG